MYGVFVLEKEMAKEWAQTFYKSQAWKMLRKRALIRDGFTCKFCGARATEVDHIKELTPDNITDRKVSLNLDNLQSLCHVCHTIKTMEDKGIVQKDCDEEYFFDEDGNLAPRFGKGKPGAMAPVRPIGKTDREAP